MHRVFFPWPLLGAIVHPIPAQYVFPKVLPEIIDQVAMHAFLRLH